MCTVTFIPTENGVYLTSNRDEKHTRSSAVVPAKHYSNGNTILYPEDGESGGSWIAAKSNGDVAVLLNGAFENHIPEKRYRLSRGIIFIAIISDRFPVRNFQSADLIGIAPFTLILYVKHTLYECRWDGKKKHLQLLDYRQAHIWSSVTLYDASVAMQRENWFRQWLAHTECIDTAAVFRFHRFGGSGNIENDLVMNRRDQLFTVSITCIHLLPGTARMNYFDMKQNKVFAGTIAIQPDQKVQHEPVIARILYTIKKAVIVTFHWEYWPFHLMYLPVYVYWLYLSIKARSFFFFSHANPSIENAGFTNERKSRIYALMPQAYYPKTILCDPSLELDIVATMLADRSISYPLIAKPDIGERGTQVKLLHSVQDLAEYRRVVKVDHLLQEYIAYEQEVGIFYYRIPGEGRGRISGIVGKEFLGVTGDGLHTIEELIMENNRFFLQLPTLKAEYADFLFTVLPKGEYQELVPYGNHARGAKFIDLTHMVTDELTSSIDSFCRQVPGFYFGRLDIKFKSWEELCAGKHFSVIELNGAGSEPTHIYDPSHSVLFAWKEIIRHLKILYTISALNAKKDGQNFMKTGTGLKMLKEHNAYMRLLTSIK